MFLLLKEAWPTPTEDLSTRCSRRCKCTSYTDLHDESCFVTRRRSIRSPDWEKANQAAPCSLPQGTPSATPPFPLKQRNSNKYIFKSLLHSFLLPKPNYASQLSETSLAIFKGVLQTAEALLYTGIV